MSSLPPTFEQRPDGPPPPKGVVADLLKDGYRFGFFQAVRLLERWQQTRAPVGRDSSPEKEVVRFGALASSDFPASQIYDVKLSPKPDNPPQMTVAFFGMTGPQGALPGHYTEILLERILKRDRTLLAFLDLFNHRLISLFYRAWEKYRFWISGERTLRLERRAASAGPDQLRGFVVDERPQLDPVGEILLSLTGMANAATRYALPDRDTLQPRTEISDQTWRYYAGLFAQRRRPAASLERLLTDHFRWPVRVQSLCGRWLLLEPSDRTQFRLGGNTRLGVETVAGQKVWDIQGKFRILLGPLGYSEFCSLLPIGDAHKPLVQLTRTFAGAHLDFDFEMRLRADELPEARCGDRKGIGPRLGWNTWLKSRQIPTQPATVRLRPYDALTGD